jgi:hypothetical protein
MNRFLTTSALACAAAFAPTSGIGEDQPVQAEAFAADRAAATIYSVANLGTGWPTELPRINNRGQVAFSVRNFNRATTWATVPCSTTARPCTTSATSASTARLPPP